jgi:hypothetical protein
LVAAVLAAQVDDSLGLVAERMLELTRSRRVSALTASGADGIFVVAGGSG